jgi:hypothetical protein|uniref:Uncharacterized protein n=1 Tax=Acrobeloides nanus TaxID=290746 RepID=A0A914DHF5_9BILA
MSYLRTLTTATLTALAALTVTLAGCSTTPPSTPVSAAPATPERTNSDIAIEGCEKLITQRLKAPATASFHTTATPPGDNAGPWILNGTVDSDNSFGAYIRTTFTCSAKLDPSTNQISVEVIITG